MKTTEKETKNSTKIHISENDDKNKALEIMDSMHNIIVKHVHKIADLEQEMIAKKKYTTSVEDENDILISKLKKRDNLSQEQFINIQNKYKESAYSLPKEELVRLADKWDKWADDQIKLRSEKSY